MDAHRYIRKVYSYGYELILSLQHLNIGHVYYDDENIKALRIIYVIV